MNARHWIAMARFVEGVEHAYRGIRTLKFEQLMSIL